MEKYLIVREEPITQTIVVVPAGHLDMCNAVASASAQAMGKSLWGKPSLKDILRTIHWFNHDQPKIVRRISRPGQLDRVYDALRRHKLSHAKAISGGSLAIALYPMPLTQIPREIRALQIAGTEGDREIEPTFVSGDVPDIRIVPELVMSTGKTAAQVAHAACVWLFGLEKKRRKTWMHKPGINTSNKPEDREDVLSIVDNGKTEILKGSITVTVQQP